MKSSDEILESNRREATEARSLAGLSPTVTRPVPSTFTQPVPQRPRANGLGAKLAALSGSVGYIPRNGYNSFHQYHYIQETDLVEAIRPLLAEAGIFLFISEEGVVREVTGKDKNGSQVALTTVRLAFEFVDGETGESRKVFFSGSGEDAGDKGLYKAYTGAVKYFLMKTFLVSTGDDPERENVEKAERKKPGPKPKEPLMGSRMSAEQAAELAQLNEALGVNAKAPNAFKAMLRDLPYERAKELLEGKK